MAYESSLKLNAYQREVAYLKEVAELLSDLKPLVHGNLLRVSDFSVDVTFSLVANDEKIIVTVYHTYGARRGRRYTKFMNPLYIAKKIRQLVADNVEKKLQTQALTAKWKEQFQREEEALKPVAAVVDGVKNVNVYQLKADENHDKSFRFEMKLSNLTEVQALQVLALLKGEEE